MTSQWFPGITTSYLGLGLAIAQPQQCTAPLVKGQGVYQASCASQGNITPCPLMGRAEAQFSSILSPTRYFWQGRKKHSGPDPL